VREEKDLRARLEREVTALQTATDAFVRATADYTNHDMQVRRLIRHVRDNVLHYLQGIWSYEHPDQRFFRHHTIEAPRLLPRTRTYTLQPLTSWPVGMTPQPGKTCYEITFEVELDPDVESTNKVAPLVELADLDKPLGFKGNYILFPLKVSNALTDYMMTPYLDAELGLRDPDDVGNWTLEEFSKFVDCLRETMGDDFASIEEDLRDQYKRILTDPLRDGEEIVVPTTSLMMESLVGSKPLMEDFKLLHRGLDVMKVVEEVRDQQLESLRKAARILDGQLGDPSVESVKNVYYRGSVPPHDGDE
jgi:hypothetical protein